MRLSGHPDPNNLKILVGDQVERGQEIGLQRFKVDLLIPSSRRRIYLSTGSLSFLASRSTTTMSTWSNLMGSIWSKSRMSRLEVGLTVRIRFPPPASPANSASAAGFATRDSRWCTQPGSAGGVVWFARLYCYRRISGCFMAIALPIVAWYHLRYAVGRASLSRSG